MDINNIEEDKTKQFIKAYEEAKAQSFIIESINKDFFFEFADCLIARIKELEEENKLLLNSKVGIDLSYDDYISKQKVKDKIEENNKLIEKCKNDEEHYSEIYVYKHDNEILKELLEEE